MQAEREGLNASYEVVDLTVEGRPGSSTRRTRST